MLLHGARRDTLLPPGLLIPTLGVERLLLLHGAIINYCDGVWKESGSHQLTDGSPERELVAKLTVRRVFFSVWRLLGLQAQCRLSHTGFSKAGLADSDSDTNCG